MNFLPATSTTLERKLYNVNPAGLTRRSTPAVGEGVVTRVGLEPTTRCLRGSCSTIELSGLKYLELFSTLPWCLGPESNWPRLPLQAPAAGRSP